MICCACQVESLIDTSVMFTSKLLSSCRGSMAQPAARKSICLAVHLGLARHLQQCQHEHKHQLVVNVHVSTAAVQHSLYIANYFACMCDCIV